MSTIRKSILALVCMGATMTAGACAPSLPANAQAQEEAVTQEEIDRFWVDYREETLAAVCDSGKVRTVPIVLNKKNKIKTPNMVKVDKGDCVRWISNRPWKVIFGNGPILTPFEGPTSEFGTTKSAEGKVRQNAGGFYKYEVQVQKKDGTWIGDDPWVDV